MSDTQKTARLSLVMKTTSFAQCICYRYMHKMFVSSSTFLKTGVYTGMHYSAVKRILYVSRHSLWVLGRCGGSNV